ncbi:hypothetical protein Pelo_14373 [Pelomyxa schiedti]|nr:hypothetical protein Pelo_14373 [Pelomyxa schiedti]
MVVRLLHAILIKGSKRSTQCVKSGILNMLHITASGGTAKGTKELLLVTDLRLIDGMGQEELASFNYVATQLFSLLLTVVQHIIIPLHIRRCYSSYCGTLVGCTVHILKKERALAQPFFAGILGKRWPQNTGIQQARLLAELDFIVLSVLCTDVLPEFISRICSLVVAAIESCNVLIVKAGLVLSGNKYFVQYMPGAERVKLLAAVTQCSQTHWCNVTKAKALEVTLKLIQQTTKTTTTTSDSS